ncbi:MAG: hypothetical protein P9M00_03170 [Candidatus Tritonobacter lacicola]|nr:hypothetical protein [Candidatus Tritonobacter lacicola]
MIALFRIFLLATLLAVFASLSSFQLLKATAVVLENEKFCGDCMEDVRRSLRDSGLFLDRLLGGKGA